MRNMYYDNMKGYKQHYNFCIIDNVLAKFNEVITEATGTALLKDILETVIIEHYFDEMSRDPNGKIIPMKIYNRNVLEYYDNNIRGILCTHKEVDFYNDNQHDSKVESELIGVHAYKVQSVDKVHHEYFDKEKLNEPDSIYKANNFIKGKWDIKKDEWLENGPDTLNPDPYADTFITKAFDDIFNNVSGGLIITIEKCTYTSFKHIKRFFRKPKEVVDKIETFYSFKLIVMEPLMGANSISINSTPTVTDEPGIPDFMKKLSGIFLMRMPTSSPFQHDNLPEKELTGREKSEKDIVEQLKYFTNQPDQMYYEYIGRTLVSQNTDDLVVDIRNSKSLLDRSLRFLSDMTIKETLHGEGYTRQRFINNFIIINNDNENISHRFKPGRKESLDDFGYKFTMDGEGVNKRKINHIKRDINKMLMVTNVQVIKDNTSEVVRNYLEVVIYNDKFPPNNELIMPVNKQEG